MIVLDAVIAIARADAPREWERYCEIAPRVLPVADAPRELLRQARLSGPYDGTQRAWGGGVEVGECFRLEQIFLERFVDAVHAHRCSVRGVPRGQFEAKDIDARLITLDSLKRVKDDRWELAGTMLYAVQVLMEPPGLPSPSPKLRNASDPQIHAEIAAEYADCKKTGRKPPNVNEIGKLVQARLRALYASEKHIRELAGDPRYDGLRRKPGRTIASERTR